MNEIPVSNPHANPMYVGGVMIPGGETRLIPAAQVPPNLRPAQVVEAPAEPVDPVLSLLGESVSDIVTQLPALDAAELDRLEAGERAGKRVRSTLVNAIAEERLRRAAAAGEGAGEADEA